MVAPRPDHRRIETLSGLLNEIAEAHKDLLGAVEEKIAAMRTADTERIKQAMSGSRPWWSASTRGRGSAGN